MNLHNYSGGLVQTNGYILAEEDGTCLLIDAPLGITQHLAELNLRATDLLLTHQHFDHVEDVAALHSAGVKVHALKPHNPELILDKEAREFMGLPVQITPFQVDHLIDPEKPLTIASHQFTVLHVPGHSPDSLAFHLSSESYLFAGDALFNGSIGRTDLPGGNHQQLLDSIRKKLYTLPDVTAVFPGHGPQTSINKEKSSNPACPNL